MEFKEYSDWQETTAFYPPIRKPDCLVAPDDQRRLTYTVLALGGEAGELQNELKKCIRDDASFLTSSRANRMVDELGDVLWYVSAVAHELGVRLETVARMNQAKIDKRRHSQSSI